jgi:chorismate dehydratase
VPESKETTRFAPLPPLAAVSYLNTLPLIWGFLHGPQRGLARLSLDVPAACADAVRSGRAAAGLLPVIEAHRAGLPFLGDVGIACRGAVRSILVVSKVPAARIRTLAADSSSRSSVALTRVLLTHHFRNPACEIRPSPPDFPRMLDGADACLLIGDPALRLDPSGLPGLHAYDLGEEWMRMTGLPMVFAVWSGYVPFDPAAFRGSLDHGRARIGDYLEAEAAKRGLSADLARDYLTRRIVYDLGPEERRGCDQYLKLAAILEEIPA